ncbi:hypothetical protein Taro_038692 [Colocasia esculenta]|uniref:Uncharacterized protein n=1 Tax=Colocasia esculenta TaxID=4460 RepID=A0A843WMY8_COLES|nr:hypothetical protein [Colocasia esculenta]
MLDGFVEAAVASCVVSSSETECCELLYPSELRVVFCKPSGLNSNPSGSSDPWVAARPSGSLARVWEVGCVTSLQDLCAHCSGLQLLLRGECGRSVCSCHGGAVGAGLVGSGLSLVDDGCRQVQVQCSCSSSVHLGVSATVAERACVWCGLHRCTVVLCGTGLSVFTLMVIPCCWGVCCVGLVCGLLSVRYCALCSTRSALLLTLSRCSMCHVASLVERCDTYLWLMSAWCWLVVSSGEVLPESFSIVSGGSEGLRYAVGLAGAFLRVFPERCLGGFGGGSPSTCLCCFCSSACFSVLSDGPCCLVVGLCILVKVLTRIALCRFWRRFFPGVLCVHFGPPLCCPCGSKCAVWLGCVLVMFSQDGSWHFWWRFSPKLLCAILDFVCPHGSDGLFCFLVLGVLSQMVVW